MIPVIQREYNQYGQNSYTDYPCIDIAANLRKGIFLCDISIMFHYFLRSLHTSKHSLYAPFHRTGTDRPCLMSKSCIFDRVPALRQFPALQKAFHCTHIQKNTSAYSCSVTCQISWGG